jgi:hypothetical protein
MKLRWVVLPLAAVAALSVSGCGLTFSSTEDDKTEHVAVTAVHINGGSGDITVQPGSAGEVRIHRRIHYNGSVPSGSTYHIDGGTLYLDTGCGHNCSVDYDIRVPEGVTVTGNNGSGDVRLTGVSTVDVEVGSGDLTVTRATGPVRLKGHSGDIRATDIRAASTDLTTSSGDINLDLATPGNVTAQAGSGDVTIRVPAGTAYRVDASTHSGDTRIAIPTDPNASYHLTLHAGSGDVVVSRS